jgi:hypothetical protein
MEYEKRGQLSSAVSFYLRTAEYGEGLLTYNSLLKLAQLFDEQNDRNYTVSNCILQAIAYMPERPEGYFLMAQFYEKCGNWQECYTFAEIGLNLSDYDSLPANIGYYGKYVLEFEKAVSAYWVGRRDESIQLLRHLEQSIVAPEYENAVKSNLGRIDASF